MWAGRDKLHTQYTPRRCARACVIGVDFNVYIHLLWLSSITRAVCLPRFNSVGCLLGLTTSKEASVHTHVVHRNTRNIAFLFLCALHPVMFSVVSIGSRRQQFLSKQRKHRSGRAHRQMHARTDLWSYLRVQSMIVSSTLTSTNMMFRQGFICVT